MEKKIVVATWNHILEEYSAYSLDGYAEGIFSNDGDNWFDINGLPPVGAFNDCEIKLIGGPRHSEIVG